MRDATSSTSSSSTPWVTGIASGAIRNYYRLSLCGGRFTRTVQARFFLVLMTDLIQIMREPTSPAAERCELCGAEMTSDHGHVVNIPRRTLLCVCRPCYLLFMQDSAGGLRFRAVPERYLLLPELAAAREGLEALQIPIGLAFFFRNSATGRTTAFYPSPAGATESELALDAWDAIVNAVPRLSTLKADVEALLIRTKPPSPESGSGGPRVIDALIVPIDACYELVGRIRRTWSGIHSGDEVMREIDAFFGRIIEHTRSAAGV